MGFYASSKLANVKKGSESTTNLSKAPTTVEQTPPKEFQSLSHNGVAPYQNVRDDFTEASELNFRNNRTYKKVQASDSSKDISSRFLKFVDNFGIQVREVSYKSTERMNPSSRGTNYVQGMQPMMQGESRNMADTPQPIFRRGRRTVLTDYKTHAIVQRLNHRKDQARVYQNRSAFV